MYLFRTIFVVFVCVFVLYKTTIQILSSSSSVMVKSESAPYVVNSLRTAYLFLLNFFASISDTGLQYHFGITKSKTLSVNFTHRNIDFGLKRLTRNFMVLACQFWFGFFWIRLLSTFIYANEVYIFNLLQKS